MLSPKAKKLKEALEKETGKMVSFRSKARYNASQARLAKNRREYEKQIKIVDATRDEMIANLLKAKANAK